MGVEVPNFTEGTSGKIELKLENAQFSMALKRDSYDLSLNGKNTLRFTILTKNTLSRLKN